MLSWFVTITIFCIVYFNAVACGHDDILNNRFKCVDASGIKLPPGHDL